MRIWINKLNGAIFLVEPWEKAYTSYQFGDYSTYAFSYHAGWIVENYDGCKFVLPLGTEDQFEDIGEF